MVLNFGVVAYMGVVVLDEQVDEDSIDEETEGQAEEDGLGVQLLHYMMG